MTACSGQPRPWGAATRAGPRHHRATQTPRRQGGPQRGRDPVPSLIVGRGQRAPLRVGGSVRAPIAVAAVVAACLLAGCGAGGQHPTGAHRAEPRRTARHDDAAGPTSGADRPRRHPPELDAAPSVADPTRPANRHGRRGAGSPGPAARWCCRAHLRRRPRPAVDAAGPDRARPLPRPGDVLRDRHPRRGLPGDRARRVRGRARRRQPHLDPSRPDDAGDPAGRRGDRAGGRPHLGGDRPPRDLPAAAVRRGGAVGGGPCRAAARGGHVCTTSTRATGSSRASRRSSPGFSPACGPARWSTCTTPAATGRRRSPRCRRSLRGWPPATWSRFPSAARDARRHVPISGAGGMTAAAAALVGGGSVTLPVRLAVAIRRGRPGAGRTSLGSPGPPGHGTGCRARTGAPFVPTAGLPALGSRWAHTSGSSRSVASAQAAHVGDRLLQATERRR